MARVFAKDFCEPYLAPGGQGNGSVEAVNYPAKDFLDDVNRAIALAHFFDGGRLAIIGSRFKNFVDNVEKDAAQAPPSSS